MEFSSTTNFPLKAVSTTRSSAMKGFAYLHQTYRLDSTRQRVWMSAVVLMKRGPLVEFSTILEQAWQDSAASSWVFWRTPSRPNEKPKRS